MVIGITGGVGSGKTTVLEYVRELSSPDAEVEIYLLDDEAKKLQEIGMPVYEEIVEEFGREILRMDGEIDRSALAEIVFSDEKKLMKLNSITKEAVVRQMEEILENCDRQKLIFMESAILLDCNLRDKCDEIWYIYADRKVRRERLKAGRGYSDERITNMFKRQRQDRYFFNRASVVIHNNDREEMKKDVKKALKDVKNKILEV